MTLSRVWRKRMPIGLTCAVSLWSLMNMSIAQAAAPPLEPSLPAPVRSGTVPIDDARLYYATYGDPNNEPIVLMHGRLGNADEFVHQIPDFAEKYYVVVFDARGRGRSTAGNQPLSFPLMAADTLALMNYLGIDSANVVGWSDGGSIGLEIAIHNPERITKLVAFSAQYSPAGFTGDCPTAQCDEFLGMERSAYARLSGKPNGIDALFGLITPLQEQLNFTPEQLGSITIPVLIMDGLQEEIIDPAHTLKLAQMIPTADLQLMNGIGHFAPWYKADEFNHAVLDYLSR